MSCERFRDAITDHACGAPIDAEATAHLENCGACRRSYDAHRRALEDVDAVLADVLTVSVSPDFASRVCAEITSGARELRIGPRAAWWLGLAAAASIAAAAFLMWQPSSEPISSRMVTSTPAVPSPSSAAAHPVAPYPAMRPGRPDTNAPPRTSHVAQAFRPAVSTTREPAVIVSPNQRRAIARMHELLQHGVLDGSVLPAPLSPDKALAELTVAPLTIPDIAVPDIDATSARSDDAPRDRQ